MKFLCWFSHRWTPMQWQHWSGDTLILWRCRRCKEAQVTRIPGYWTGVDLVGPMEAAPEVCQAPQREVR